MGLVLVLGLAVGAYLAWVWVPVFYDHLNVERVVREHANLAVKDPDDARLVARMTEAIGRIATIEEVGEDGRIQTRPAIEVQPGDVTWERQGSTLRVSFEYIRQVPYPFLDRWQERYFAVDLTTDISPPRWNGGK